jgi:hypothetical protein
MLRGTAYQPTKKGFIGHNQFPQAQLPLHQWLLVRNRYKAHSLALNKSKDENNLRKSIQSADSKAELLGGRTSSISWRMF